MPHGKTCPERHGFWSALYDRFTRWSDAGIFEAVFDALAIDADMQDYPLMAQWVERTSHRLVLKKRL